MNEKNEILKNPKILGQVEREQIDLNKYEGLKTLIASVEYERHAEHGVYAKIKTANLEKKDDKLTIQATKIVGLVEEKDEENNLIGYGWVKGSKADLLLQKFAISTFEDLIGKEVIVIRELKKDGRQFLTF